MANYHVIGIKFYSGEIQLTLDKIMLDEQNDIINNLTTYTREADVEMFGTRDLRDGNKKLLNDKHGEHSRYFLLNDNAMDALRQHDVSLTVLEELELDDPLNLGYSPLIRSSRFI